MTVNIIIVTYNGSRWIRACLSSVFGSTFNGHLYVAVVDNASSDGTADIVEREFPEADLIRLNKNTGFVGGNTIGITEALRHPPDYVFLLNQDTEIEPGTVSELVRVAEDSGAGIVQGMLLLGDERHLVNNAGNALHYLGFGFVKHYREPAERWAGQEPFEIGYASGAAMLIRRDVLETVGLFDESFFSYHEDLDLCWRAKLAGFKVMLAPKAIVYHYYEFSRNKKMLYWAERNRWAVLLKNYSLKTLILLMPALFFIELAMLVYSALGGWLHLKIKSYGWILMRFGAILASRRRIQRIRKIHDRSIIRSMDSKLLFSEIRNPMLTYVISPFSVLYYQVIRFLV